MLHSHRSLGFVIAGVLLSAVVAFAVVPPLGQAQVKPVTAVTSSVLSTAEGAAVTQNSADPNAPNSASSPPTADPLGTGPLRTDGGDIVDADGRVVHISGVNWFGLETGTFAPQGLWARSLNDMLDQIVQAGFNTIRLPYSDQLFDPNSIPNGIDFQKNPDLQGLTGLQIMDQVIERAGDRGLKVILDRHRPDASGQSTLWYTDHVSEQQWINDWVMLATRYRGNPTVIGADLDNEPHGSATWGDGNRLTDWRLAAERAGDAVLQANPDWLIFVEGIEHQGNDWYWWGGNLSLAGQFPVELSEPGKLVYEAHDYGPGVSNQQWFQAPNFPANLASIWNTNWAYLKLTGIAPVLVGEFGGRSVGTDPEGVWQRTLFAYLQTNAFDYTYWCWNPNSGDTGGVLEDDWTTLDQAKLSMLQAYQSPLLGAPEPAAAAQALIAAYQGPTVSARAAAANTNGPASTAVGNTIVAVPQTAANAAAPASVTTSFAEGGPFDPDPQHVVLGIGGPTDPDPAHRQARQADEQRYLDQTGAPWAHAVYVTGARGP
jgi:endoglucanase